MREDLIRMLRELDGSEEAAAEFLRELRRQGLVPTPKADGYAIRLPNGQWGMVAEYDARSPAYLTNLGSAIQGVRSYPRGSEVVGLALTEVEWIPQNESELLDPLSCCNLVDSWIVKKVGISRF